MKQVHNASTGAIEVRDLTADELAQHEIDKQADEQRQPAETDAQRHAAYVAESDPLFFKWQRGEGTEQAWLDKIAEIQARYPDPS